MGIFFLLWVDTWRVIRFRQSGKNASYLSGKLVFVQYLIRSGQKLRNWEQTTDDRRSNYTITAIIMTKFVSRSVCVIDISSSYFFIAIYLLIYLLNNGYIVMYKLDVSAIIGIIRLPSSGIQYWYLHSQK